MNDITKKLIKKEIDSVKEEINRFNKNLLECQNRIIEIQKRINGLNVRLQKLNNNFKPVLAFGDSDIFGYCEYDKKGKAIGINFICDDTPRVKIKRKKNGY